jgi:hypothetical protein
MTQTYSSSHNRRNIMWTVIGLVLIAIGVAKFLYEGHL